ncbi:putative intron-binding protein aquarius [Septoria linicola]|nr:putative intron-binding protein aquarius [Septoria linicola]
MARPGISDLTGDHGIAQIARDTWLTTTSPKVLPATIAELWKLAEDDQFSPFSLLLLEQLQALERYLWPGYTENASHQHVLLIALLVNTKRSENLPTWAIFANAPDEFSSFFRRVLHLTIDSSLATNLREYLLAFIVGAYQSLDHGIVRKECAPLVSIGIWHNLHSNGARERTVARSTQLQKAWRASGKKFDNADAAGQARLRFERSWLYLLVLSFFDKLYAANKKSDDVAYCERFLELLCDLQSQLPTRRYVNTLLHDLNVLPAIALSPLHQQESRIRDFYDLLVHYTHFPIDDQTGRQLSRQEYEETQNASISRLQKVAMKLQPDKLKILILTNFGALGQRSELQSHLQDLSDEELLQLCQEFGLRTREYPETTQLLQDRVFLLEILLSEIEQKSYYTERMRKLQTLPTEDALYNNARLPADEHVVSQPLAIPKLNLQYLTVGDFLWRSFTLYRYEAFYSLRKHLEDTIKRLQPRRGGGIVRLDGFSRMAIPIPKPAIIETSAPRVGETVPAEVKVEIILDVSRLQPGLRREWESLRPDDTVYLLALQPEDNAHKLTNGAAAKQSVGEKFGLKAVRCAEVLSVLDENSRALKHKDGQDSSDSGPRPRQRRLLLRLDAASYKADKDREATGKPDIYESVNLVVRRRARENNFRPVLESIKQLATSDAPVPSWFEEVFLGIGDPASATYKRLPSKLQSVNYRDTFLDWQHLIESLPGKTIEPDPKLDSIPPPPYVLQNTGSAPAPPPAKSKKRRRDQPDGPDPAPAAETFRVSTYQPPNSGPYPEDAPKLNHVRFTPTQVEAVTAGTQPGLSLIVGPPGTGKTDVATQVISNIYHNFPQQRTLLIAHSNQALNQLFQKIVALDIDERHLLRLGHGEEELTTEASFSKAGRIESFLERGGRYLAEVQRLAASIEAPGAHGSTCETAEYFDQVWVQPRWKRYWDNIESADASAEQIVGTFPFQSFFADAPQPLFLPDASKEQLIDTAKGCERHINRIFSELADIRPFEILRAQRDKSNYLLVKEARIIAMTSTHAAIRRQEIAQLGFKYDNVIMEEAAQITEVENFIPFVLQKPRIEDGKAPENPLKRIVLVGDHLQNSPVVQNNALKSYANLEQSLFQRLVRLGVPHTILDAQGRSRPSLANLYKWRYPSLTNLPFTSTAPEFTSANAGFRHAFQFIDVPDYKGQGESEPTPHFIQNLGEAEYAVALYQYMRLLGYPAEKISIVTAYSGQRALIRDVLKHRCETNRLFGMPGWVGTVDKYQGEQNDYVILSLTRTKSPGYLRDLRRLTVALSRARLGLYVLGRKEVFESSLELREAFALFFERGTKLELVTDEMFPTKRAVDEVDGDAEGVVEMVGVEHLGQYVFEMTNAKVRALKEGQGIMPPEATGGRVEEDGEGEGDEGEGDGEVGDDDVVDEDGDVEV